MVLVMGMIRTELSNKRAFQAIIGALAICTLAGCCLFPKPYYKNPLAVNGFFKEKKHFVPLKISSFSLFNSPQLEVEIENKVILSEVDLSWGGGMALPLNTLQHLRNKTLIGRQSSCGLKGKIYESDVYELPQIHIGKMVIYPMRVKEELPEFVEDSILMKGEKNEIHQGRIGWRAFSPFNVLLDCEHSAMVMCDSLETLNEQGYSIDTFIEAPLLLDRGTIDFEVVTEAGSLRCTLDTASTWNYLNKDLENPIQDHRLLDLDDIKEKSLGFNPKNEDLLVFNSEDRWDTETFQISEKDFGPLNFIKMKSPLGLDAILGMEFIDNHLIFIDFSNKKIYFSKLPEERSLFERAYDFFEDKIINL